MRCLPHCAASYAGRSETRSPPWFSPCRTSQTVPPKFTSEAFHVHRLSTTFHDDVQHRRSTTLFHDQKTFRLCVLNAWKFISQSCNISSGGWGRLVSPSKTFRYVSPGSFFFLEAGVGCGSKKGYVSRACPGPRRSLAGAESEAPRKKKRPRVPHPALWWRGRAGAARCAHGRSENRRTRMDPDAQLVGS